MTKDSENRFQEAIAYLGSFTDYEQILHTLPERTTFDLGRVERLLDDLGNPHRHGRIVHITGTKGKTTVTYLTSALLSAHGLKTFRFVSPHVETLHERFAIDGREISSDEFADLVLELRPWIEKRQNHAPEDVPSFFETLTAIGFLWAKRLSVHAMAIEVGLGGRLDATNVVNPAVTVITSIGLDHVRILGATRTAIASEKAGILKPSRPALVGLTPGDPAFDVVRARASELGCPLAHPGLGMELEDWAERRGPDGAPEIHFSGSVFEQRLTNVRLPAGSVHQAWNALLAAASTDLLLRTIGRRLDPRVAEDVLSKTAVPGRAEWLPGPPPVLLDGAHTAESLEAVLLVATRLAEGRPIQALLGLTRDRDPTALFAPFVSICAAITLTGLPTPRSRPADEVKELLPPGGCERSAIEDLGKALDSALERAQKDGALLVISGSLYLVGRCRTILRERRTAAAGGAR